MADDLGIPVEVLPNRMFLVERAGRVVPDPSRRPIMEEFYRVIRRRFRLLLDDQGEPEQGRWNFDEENRRRLPDRAALPQPPRFEPDALTRAVIAEVEAAGFGVGSGARLQPRRDPRAGRGRRRRLLPPPPARLRRLPGCHDAARWHPLPLDARAAPEPGPA